MELLDLFSRFSDKYFKVKDEYCTYEGIKIKEEESVPAPLGQCMMVTCFNAAENHFSFRICKNFVDNPDCKKIDFDTSKLYPDCCPRQICDSENN
ncbi:hypothetical protein ILUMI_00216 [Ignelater luminosus]|uniref:Single domain-containing protein n=1 Tax=Ignelater luminosus TaxID=2038154 RepID=A0A8K0GNB3_IGNLU|nr:hypothetical protein ILUMI_00216 [Ignelater luminosus]